MLLKISARRLVAVRARCTVVGLCQAISPIQNKSQKRYTPRQSDDWLRSRAVAGVARTTALQSMDHKTVNYLNLRGEHK